MPMCVICGVLGTRSTKLSRTPWPPQIMQFAEMLCFVVLCNQTCVIRFVARCPGPGRTPCSYNVVEHAIFRVTDVIG